MEQTAHAARPRRAVARSLILPLGAALGLLSLAATGAGCRRGETSAVQIRPTEDAAPVRITTGVARGIERPMSLATTGTLVADQQSEVTPLVGGRVTDVLVERGSVVHEGDVLMRLRDVDYRTSAAQANAMLDQSRARLGLGPGGSGRFDPESTADVRAAQANRDLAEDGLRRAEVLARSGSISDAELEQRRQQAAAAREQYNSTLNNVRGTYFGYRNAQVALQQTQRNLQDSVVRAPFAGEIAERRANVGEYVTAQRAVVVLVRTNPLRVELQVPQERPPFVRQGQSVEISIDGFPNRTFPGTIRYISPALRADSRALVAEAVVPNDAGELRPGLFVTARIVLNQRENLVSVPRAAVLSEAGTHRVFVVDNGGRVQERVVAVAERTSDNVLLTSGVQANETVATDRLDRLTDGSRVLAQ
jgi:RND family efflux transporter MFP subunit